MLPTVKDDTAMRDPSPTFCKLQTANCKAPITSVVLALIFKQRSIYGAVVNVKLDCEHPVTMMDKTETTMFKTRLVDCENRATVVSVCLWLWRFVVDAKTLSCSFVCLFICLRNCYWKWSVIKTNHWRCFDTGYCVDAKRFTFKLTSKLSVFMSLS